MKHHEIVTELATIAGQDHLHAVGIVAWLTAGKPHEDLERALVYARDLRKDLVGVTTYERLIMERWGIHGPTA